MFYNRRIPASAVNFLTRFVPLRDSTVKSSVYLTPIFSSDFREFGEGALKCLPGPDYVPPADEIERRRDFRNDVVCSVDPPGCKDIDDALSCKKLPNGNYEARELLLRPIRAMHIVDTFRVSSSSLHKKSESYWLTFGIFTGRRPYRGRHAFRSARHAFGRGSSRALRDCLFSRETDRHAAGIADLKLVLSGVSAC